MRHLLLTLALVLMAARAEAIPIHPNMISVAFGAITFSAQVPAHVHFDVVDGTFGLANPSTGFFEGLAGHLALDGAAPPAFGPIDISVDAIVRIWNWTTPNLQAVLPSLFHATLLGDGTSIATWPSIGGSYFSAASLIYIVQPNGEQDMHWDSHMPLTIDAQDITAVPEPCSLLLLGTGLIALRTRYVSHSILHLHRSR